MFLLRYCLPEAMCSFLIPSIILIFFYQQTIIRPRPSPKPAERDFKLKPAAAPVCKLALNPASATVFSVAVCLNGKGTGATLFNSLSLRRMRQRFLLPRQPARCCCASADEDRGTSPLGGED